jgi:4-diphosphocytidyl-2-C-methyl-D-erythritol kinase
MGQACGVRTELAFAKLTRSLRVSGVRADGYHLIDAEMLTIDLADELTFSDGDGLEIAGAAPGLPVTAGDDNLVRKTLVAVGRRAHVRLEKRIPAGGGLGGGSADAAAVLRWAGVDDVEIAVGLGADVPFCLAGGRARVTGIGEYVEALPFEDVVFTLLTPPFGVETAAVYRAWDELGATAARGPNDLEAPALVVEPRLAEYRNRLADMTGRTPVLAGSGSTWFVEGEFPGEGRVVVRATCRRDAASGSP